MSINYNKKKQNSDIQKYAISLFKPYKHLLTCIGKDFSIEISNLKIC